MNASFSISELIEKLKAFSDEYGENTKVIISSEEDSQFLSPIKSIFAIKDEEGNNEVVIGNYDIEFDLPEEN